MTCHTYLLYNVAFCVYVCACDKKYFTFKATNNVRRVSRRNNMCRLLEHISLKEVLAFSSISITNVNMSCAQRPRSREPHALPDAEEPHLNGQGNIVVLEARRQQAQGQEVGATRARGRVCSKSLGVMDWRFCNLDSWLQSHWFWWALSH